MSNGGAVPTGCYKCGRPGHWSRDCPSDPAPATATQNNSNQAFQSNPNFDLNTRSRPPLPNQKPKQKPPRRTRPKLTPDLLLSDAGIGRILRYFPRAFKCRGRGHEVSDLKHLLGLYAEWHSRLLPYYSFDQFIHKVEQVGSMQRVKACLRDLQDRVANGIDLTKLQDPQHEENSIDEPTNLQDPQHEENSIDEQAELNVPTNLQEDNLQNESQNNFHDDIPQDKRETTMEESYEGAVNSKKIEMSEEIRSRMEASRLKALARAAARSRLRASS